MSRHTYVSARIDDVDIAVERVSRLIDFSARTDRELAAGHACSQSLTSVQSRIDAALASAESLLKAINAAKNKSR
jgi:hypothetical protein